MREIIFYAVIVLISIIVLLFAHNIISNKCENAGGQVIIHGAQTGCIYPSKK